MYFFIALIAYLVFGYLLHLVIFPEVKPHIGSYFKPGEEFYSKAEGFKQKVEKQADGFVYCSLEIEPFAGGPPKHIHADFDEVFEVENGELSVWVDGEIKKLHPGEKLLVPKGTPHRPYNETASAIRIKGQIAFPEKFAYHLPQVYGYMERHPDYETSKATLLQMVLFNRAGFDSYVADGPPVIMQKTLGFLLTPMARLLGYRSYYKQFDIHHS